MNRKKQKIKIYNVRRHKRMIIFWVIIVFLVCLFVIPYIISGIYKILIKFDCIDKDVIPGYLGGLMGIVIGFFIEGTLIEQYKHLNKYQSMVKSLEHILEEMEKTCIECGCEKKLCEINSFVFEDIISSVEYDSIFFNLPRYFLCFSNKNKGIIHQRLHNINSKISAINRANKFEVKLYKGLFESVEDFFSLTKQEKNYNKNVWEDKLNEKNQGTNKQHQE